MYYEDQRSFTTIVKHLLIINIIVFLGCWLDNSYFLTKTFALWSPSSAYFRFWQPLTYMFMHGGFWHIFFNMYTLVIFGIVTERMIGSRKFLILYLVCGLAAAALHLGVNFLTGGPGYPTVGASGAIYGVLVAYAMLFPESRMMLLFPPVVLKAKWLAAIFIGIELLSGVLGTADGVAHFAHLGGALAGWLLILFWKHTGTLFDRY
ncbi:MAG: rhomboid family intramembrane serine protease [Bacteroidales bacterium]|nr:rhomboid family intramembrane serine protease [Bacteroidales bacterium]